MPFPVSIQFSSVAQSCLSLCDPMNRSTPGLLVHHQLLESTQTHAHCVGDAIQPSHPLSSPSPPAFNLSQHQGLFNESAFCIRWPKYWSFSFNISPSNEHPGLIFRMDWLDLLCCLTTSNLPWFMDLIFHVPMHYWSLQHWTLLLPPDTSTNWRFFPFWLRLFIPSRAISLLFSHSILGTYWPG